MSHEKSSGVPSKKELEQILSQKRNERALHASSGDVEERIRLDEEIAELEKRVYH